MIAVVCSPSLVSSRAFQFWAELSNELVREEDCRAQKNSRDMRDLEKSPSFAENDATTFANFILPYLS